MATMMMRLVCRVRVVHGAAWEQARTGCTFMTKQGAQKHWMSASASVDGYFRREYNVTEVISESQHDAGNDAPKEQQSPPGLSPYGCTWVEHNQLDGHAVCQLTGLRLRDLRFLDPMAGAGVLLRADSSTSSRVSSTTSSSSAASTSSTSTVPLSRCILAFPSLKLMVTHNRALVFEARVPIVQRLHRLLDASPHCGVRATPRAAPPFGLAVFDTSLNVVYRDMRNQVIIVSKMLERISRRLNGLDDTGSTEILSAMLSVRKSALELKASLGDVVQTSNELLRSDADLDALAVALTNDRNATHDEVEIMLEEHVRCTTGLAARLALALDTLDMSKQFYHIRIGDLRNSLLRTSLHISIGALSVAAGALVAGVFGQNLTSGLEEHPQMFLYATGGIVAGCGALGGFLYRRVQPTGVLERIQAVGAPSGSAAPLASASDPTAVGAHLHLLGAVRELSTKFLSIEQDMRAIGVAHNSVGGSNDDAVDDNSVQATRILHELRTGVPARVLLPVLICCFGVAFALLFFPIARLVADGQRDDSSQEVVDMFELLLRDLDRDKDGRITLNEFLQDF